MKKLLVFLLILFTGLTINGACHRCRLQLAQKKAGRVHTAIKKAGCAVKRFITRRRCCNRNCYKNNSHYRVQVIKNVKDRFANGMALCEKCGQHHICHVCGRKQCLIDCNDHDTTKEMITTDAEILKI